MEGSRLYHVNRLAAYNRWMNERLYAVCAQIPDHDRKRDLGAFFRSIHGTFNHLLLVDRLWLGRLVGEPYAIDALDQELYADFDELRRQREAEDRRLIDWVAGQGASDLDRIVRYVSAVDRQPRRFRTEDILLHLFHHQTHHRGQITTLVSQLGHDFGDTDLIFMPGTPTTNPG